MNSMSIFNGVKVNRACQLSEVGIIFTENGLVAVLKKVTVSFMSTVIIDHISCQKLPHAM